MCFDKKIEEKTLSALLSAPRLPCLITFYKVALKCFNDCLQVNGDVMIHKAFMSTTILKDALPSSITNKIGSFFDYNNLCIIKLLVPVGAI